MPRISDLILRTGDATAAGIAARGAGWSRSLSDLGSIPAQMAQRTAAADARETERLRRDTARLGNEETRGRLDATKKMADVYAQHGNDPEKLFPAMAAIDPMKTFQTQASYLNLQKTQLDHQQSIAEHMSRDLLGITSAEDALALADRYDKAGVDELQSTVPMLKELAQSWNQNSPKAIQDHVYNVFTPALEQVKQRQLAADKAAAELATQAKTAPERLEKFQKLAAQTFSNVSDPAGFQSAMDMFAAAVGEDPIGKSVYQQIAQRFRAVGPDGKMSQEFDPAVIDKIKQWDGKTDKPDAYNEDAYLRQWASEHGVPDGQKLTTAQQRTAMREYHESRRDNSDGAGMSATPVGDYSKTGDDFLQTIPQSERAMVKKIANYDEGLDMIAARGGERTKFMRWVSQYNPNYRVDNYKNVATLKKNFQGGGPQGQQVAALNTAILHMDELIPLINDLDNGSVQSWNRLKNWWSENIADVPAPTNFTALQGALAGEIASVLSKGSGTVSEIEAQKEAANKAQGPRALAGWVKTLVPTLGSKAFVLEQQYHQIPGLSPTDEWHAVFPKQRDILLKYGYDPVSGSHKKKSAPQGAFNLVKDKSPGPYTLTDARGRKLRVMKHEDGTVTVVE